MKKPRNNAVTAVYLVLKKDGKVLLGKRCNTGYQDGNYQVPAGHVDADELPKQAMVREAKEEIGVDIDEKVLRFVHLSFRPKHDPTGDRVDIFFEASEWKGEITNTEPEKCDDLNWFDLNQLPQNTVPHVRVALECIQKGEFFSELNLQFIQDNYKL